MFTPSNATPHRNRYDAVVVGAGPNGLAAAVTLAERGLAVLLCEQAGTIGGGSRTAELTRPGFLHDICAAIHPLAVASPFLRRLPLADHGLEWIHPPTPLAHPLDDGTAVTLERSLKATAVGLGDDGESFQRLFRRWVGEEEPLLDGILGPLRIPAHPLRMARFGCLALQSAAGLARRRFRGEPARALFAGNAAHSILALDRFGTAAAGLVLTMAGLNGGWPLARGGSGRVVGALASLFESLGGEIVTDYPVRSLDRLPQARAYLFDTSPSALASIAGDRLPARYRRALGRFRHGPGSFKIDWALDGPIPWRAEACRQAGTVHVGGGFDEIVAAEHAVANGRHPERPFVLLAQPSLFDPTRAPAGAHTAWGYCHVPSGSPRDMTDPIERQIERFAPGFGARILERHVAGPADLERYNPNYIGGDIGGGSNDLVQLLARPVLRWVPYATPAPELFLCSASTPPGGGVHGMCGYHAARAALQARFPELPASM